MTAEMASSRALVSTIRLTNSNPCLHSLMFLAMILAWTRPIALPRPRPAPINGDGNGTARLALDFDSARSYRTKPDIGRLLPAVRGRSSVG